MKTGIPRSTSWGAVDGRVLEAGELGHRGVEAGLESFDFSEPAIATGFTDAFAEVLDDLDEAWSLAGVDLENGAANASLTELILKACAANQSDLRSQAVAEVLSDSAEFGVSFLGHLLGIKWP